MKTSEYIEVTIDRLPKGYVFTYSDFINNDLNRKEAVIKALSRLVSKGKIAKLSKGKFYKPETSVFGILQPDQSQIVKDLLEENGRITGYLTGYSIYNQLGLNTQVSNTIQIGKNEIRPAFKRGRFTISFIKQKNNISRENIPLLQILDAIRYIKKIPDTTIETACKRFIAILQEIPEKAINSLVRLALKYPPSTQALLGLILEESGNGTFSGPLRKSLNPITTYKLPGVEALTTTTTTTENWNIK